MLALESAGVEYAAGFGDGGQGVFTGRLSVGVCRVWGVVSGSFILEKPIS